MTKKDYIKFADLLIRVFKSHLNTNTEKEQEILEMVRSGLIDILSEDNPNFNQEKFNDYITQKTI